MRVLITGSGGLVGSACVERFCRDGHTVMGTDIDARGEWFGKAGSIQPNLDRIKRDYPSYEHFTVDVSWYLAALSMIQEARPDVIIHCAAQPSHDKSREIPLRDFSVNALGTVNLLEATRLYFPNAIFVFMSTNKVYGDNPNRLPTVKLEARLDLGGQLDGIAETMNVDHCTHSVFGASKLAADVMAQEYGRTYGMRTICLRAGCLTGAAHAGVELHGFLSYLTKCAVGRKPYTVYGYEGKQVRDNLDAVDIAEIVALIAADPPEPGTVFNLGGGRDNSVSILEAAAILTELGYPPILKMDGAQRLGDHACYVTDMRKLRARYPTWQPTRTVRQMLADIVVAEVARCAQS